LLKGKNAVITGCARGIGKEILELFALNGSNVWACARKKTDEFEQNIRSLSDRYQVIITPVYFDLADASQTSAAAKSILNSKTNIDIIVNNAGITYNALFQMTSMRDLREVFEINFFSLFLFTQILIKRMVRQRSGSIVNISSSAAIDANQGRSAYGASKAAVITMTKAIARELADSGIRANAIAPGITETEMVAASMTDEFINQVINETSMKRMGMPSEIAQAALFLASDMSSYVTGQVLRVDGGM
jgi:3-oxoacyl-[acyl-carrier protein] reductase